MPTQAFSYRRSIAPSVWMLLAIMSVELVVLHPLIALWSVPVALVLSLLSFGTIGWPLWAVLSFDRCPVVLTASELVMRVGVLKGCRVSLDQVADATGVIEGRVVKGTEVLNLAILTWPNVQVDLHHSIRVQSRSIARVVHRLDDARAFLAAIHQRLGASRG